MKTVLRNGKHERFVIGRCDVGQEPGTGTALVTISHDGRIATHKVAMLGVVLGSKLVVAVSGLPAPHNDDAEIYAALTETFIDSHVEHAKRQARLS